MDYKEFQKMNNLRPIERNEIILDCDNKQGLGDLGIRRVAMMMSAKGYRIEVYKAEGQKSYHAHIKNIPHLEELSKEQLKSYKELIIKKYIAEVKERINAPEVDDLDFSVCGVHLIAEENKPHFKYKTPKLLIEIINKDSLNFCEVDVFDKCKLNNIIINEYSTLLSSPTSIHSPTSPSPTFQQGNGITAQISRKISILQVAQNFGLSVKKNKCVCPFHADSSPSLFFYPQQARFYCFGCQTGGNIIYFYALMKKYGHTYTSKKEVKNNE